MEKLVLVVGILHFVVEYILLMAADRLTGFSATQGRLLLVALVASAHGGLCLIPGLGFLGGAIWRWGLLLGLGLWLYGYRGKGIARLAVFLLLNFGIEGFQLLADENQLLCFAAAGAMVAMVCVLCFRDGGSQRYLATELNCQGVRLEITALADTGNTLRDPITGEAVLIVSHKVAFALTGLTKPELAKPLETMAAGKVKGLRLIPYHCVGCDNGMLLAMRMPGCKIGGKEKDLLVAFAPAGLGKEGSFQALAGGIV